MKKLLLASTALVATAGVAQADVALSGSAEMGIYGGEDIDTQFFTDVDVTFTMSGEADNGLTFGASIDLDESDGADSTCDDAVGLGDNAAGTTCAVNGDSDAFDPNVQGGESIFVSFGGATLTMGDTDGALDARVPEMALAGGSLADDETAHNGFDNGAILDGAGGDGQIARFDYAFGAAVFSLSAEQDANGAGDEPVIGVGVSYAADVSGIDMNVGLGYQKQEDNRAVTSFAVTGGFANGLTLGATVSNWDIDGVSDDATHTGLGIGYEMNALAIGFNYGQYELDGDQTSGWGLATVYDLGGGISLRAGYGWSSEDEIGGFGGATEDFDTFSLGAKMSF
ncbi:porin [Roseivivax sp. GX 12232]|uniref:porin n=1 Tax=Roseivivax sp. GX 12232 TaxID=2900547 RepID=UPI001E3D1F1E|nr:porin [Roseivivax sp. GX 12232]MCE0506022.1 porin [Roseivivax sp. GX 12232]